MGSLEKVPCLHVDENNLDKMWPHIVSSIQLCHWIGMDLELSGIGNKQNFGLKEVDERYTAFTQVAKTRGIVAIGLSTFQFLPEPKINVPEKKVVKVKEPLSREEIMNTNDIESWSDLEDANQVNQEQSEWLGWPIVSHSFNIFSRCREETVLEEDAKTFLQNHDFDFERQSTSGVQYSRVNSSDSVIEDLSVPSLKNLLHHIIIAKKPVVFHNGFLDLMFLYQNLYLDLPLKMETFLTNCHDIFVAGIYDTKYITEHVTKCESSFLEYVYYLHQRNNVENMMDGKTHMHLTFPEFDGRMRPGLDIEFRNMKTRIMEARPKHVEICYHYGSHGWCSDGSECKRSHNIDLILDLKREKELRKRTKKVRNCQSNALKKLSSFNESLVIREESSGDTNNQEICLESLGKVKSGAHQSGYDAFMTGYVFGTFLTTTFWKPPFDHPLSSKNAGLNKVVNNLFLSGKTYPLRVFRGQYDKPSNDHRNKLSLIQGMSHDKACLVI